VAGIRTRPKPSHSGPFVRTLRRFDRWATAHNRRGSSLDCGATVAHSTSPGAAWREAPPFSSLVPAAAGKAAALAKQVLAGPLRYSPAFQPAMRSAAELVSGGYARDDRLARSLRSNLS
jgi:hypothetical protein